MYEPTYPKRSVRLTNRLGLLLIVLMVLNAETWSMNVHQHSQVTYCVTYSKALNLCACSDGFRPMGGSAGHGISLHSLHCSGESVHFIMTAVAAYSV